MDVYLVPVGADRYELYCEIPDADTAEDGAAKRPQGYFRRLVQRFREMIAEAERERHEGIAQPAARGRIARMKARALRWVAESIAEQRVLWHLRQQAEACLHYPDDIDQQQGIAVLRQQLGGDSQKHRRWLIIDGIALVLSVVVLGPFFLLIPGVANLPAAYFGFRVVGHYLSLRGASRGLDTVAWRYQSSAPLTELRRVLALDPDARGSRVDAIAETLRLEHLATFFQRSAVST